MIIMDDNDDYVRWNRLTADEWAALFPAKPPSIRKMARVFRQLGAGGEVFTINEYKLAGMAGVGVRTFRRYLPVFERYGILEVHRWRYRKIGPSPNSYRVFIGAVIPENWKPRGGKFPVSTDKKRKSG